MCMIVVCINACVLEELIQAELTTMACFYFMCMIVVCINACVLKKNWFKLNLQCA